MVPKSVSLATASQPTACAHGHAAFPADRLQTLAEIEEWHFWFSGRRRMVVRLLDRHLPAVDPRRVLDLGCGMGSMLDALARRAPVVVGLDGRREGLSARRRHDPRSRLVQGDGVGLPFTDGAFDIVIALDVLEHADDRRLLAEARRVLADGGLLIATVPALPRLWSHRDDAAGHLRRYTARHLREVMAAERFTIRDVRYFQSLLLPLVAITRWAGRRGPAARDLEDRPARLVNGILSAVTRLELALGRAVRWPLGSSLAAVGQKP